MSEREAESASRAVYLSGVTDDLPDAAGDCGEPVPPYMKIIIRIPATVIAIPTQSPNEGFSL